MRKLKQMKLDSSLTVSIFDMLPGRSWNGVSCPNQHNLGHFRGDLHSSQPDWCWQTKQYRKIHRLHTTQKAHKWNNPKHSKTKLPCLSILRHSALFYNVPKPSPRNGNSLGL